MSKWSKRWMNLQKILLILDLIFSLKREVLKLRYSDKILLQNEIEKYSKVRKPKLFAGLMVGIMNLSRFLKWDLSGIVEFFKNKFLSAEGEAKLFKILKIKKEILNISLWTKVCNLKLYKKVL